jgi:hypothetical protein
MKHSLNRALGIGLVLVATAIPLNSAHAAERQQPRSTTPGVDANGAAEPDSKPRYLPFHGKIDKVDRAAKTITLTGEKHRVVQITAETRIVKAGKPATIEAAVVGEEVGGSAQRLADGRLQARSLRLGPKPDAPSKKKTGENSQAGKARQ